MDAQIDIADFLRTRVGRSFVDSFAADMDDKSKHGQLARELLHFGPPTILQADPIWVDNNICDLIEAASERWKPEPLRTEDVLCPSGFVLFERPLFVRDVHGKQMGFRALSWNPVITAVSDEEYRRGRTAFVEGPLDFTPPRVVTPAGNIHEVALVLAFWSHIEDEDDYTIDEPDLNTMRAAIHPHNFVLSHITVVGFDELPIDSPERPIEATFPIEFQVFCRLAQQRVLERERVRPDRPYRRRAKRYGKEDAHVTVIRLRRPKHKTDGESQEVDWKSRWIVGGHWRKQRYGKRDEEPYYRNIWIAPYVKGPDDKPLVLRELRAWEFVR